MNSETEHENRAKVPPTLSPVTFANFVETHRRTLPSRIDRSLMKSNSGTDQPKILNGLQFMGLTDASGKPTSRFEQMRDTDGDDLKATWVEIIKSAYPAMFRDFDLGNATQHMIDERFREEYGISGDTVRKAVAFFITLARDNGIPLSPYVKQARKRSPRVAGTAQKRRIKRQNGPDVVEVPADFERDSPPPSRLHPAVQAWLDEMPAKGEAWDPEDFEEWFSILRSSIKRAYKINI